MPVACQSREATEPQRDLARGARLRDCVLAQSARTAGIARRVCQKTTVRVIARSEATWQSRAGSSEFAEIFQNIQTILRDCHGRKRPRNDKIGLF